MVISTRGILAIGLGLAGLACWVGPSLSQAQQQSQDGAVQKAANTGARKPKPAVPPVIGTVDLDVIFKNYKRVESASKEFHAAFTARRGELMKMESEARQEAEMLSKLTPGTEDFRKRENKVTEWKARLEASREQTEREFTLRQAESMATLYKEIQAMVAAVAQWHGMTYVLRVSNKQPTGTEPNSVLAAINDTMVYADPRNDITNDVVHNLNLMYERAYRGAPNSPSTPTTSGRSPATAGSPGAAGPGEN